MMKFQDNNTTNINISNPTDITTDSNTQENNQDPHKFKSGFVSIIGRPSVGKSTLINYICGHDTSIVSPYPQTTRNIIKGIVTEHNYQIVFLDTPGIHISKKKYGMHLTKQAKIAIQDADVLLYVLDAMRMPQDEEQTIVEVLQEQSQPILVAINKMDKEKPKIINTHLELLRNNLGDKITNCHFISALEGINVQSLLLDIAKHLPQQEALYPSEYYTDQSPDFRICEQVRAAALEYMKEELPHALNTEILESSVKHRDEEDNPTHVFIRVQIIVEQESQKAIVIGKQGSMIKKIRINAMKKLKPLFPYKIQLELKAVVKKNWRSQWNSN